ncbi:MAG: nucleotidyltransferase family protein [Prolixibacteraceae bacterium]|nr:nucleotidyltransferase family protein [Prolixibacteraceae bacterium]
MAKIPILLLAAGGSTRMGQPKQLLPWDGQTLIEHQIQTLLKTGHPVSVVIGSNSDLIIPVIENFPVNVLINTDWESGMGSSISFGIDQIIQKFPDADGVLITLLDQPLLTTSYFQKMLGAYQPDSQQIIVSQSASGWTGVPVLFDRCYLKELSELSNDEGAKKITKRHEESVILMEGGELLLDMDTPETYQQLLSKYFNYKPNMPWK